MIPDLASGARAPTPLAAAAAFGFALLGFAPSARAELVSLSATGFTRHCPCVVDGSQESNTHDGVVEMTGQANNFYAAVDFPKEGQKVCSLALVYRDINGADAIRARMLKKVTTNNSSTAFSAPPVLIGSVSSDTGTPDTLRVKRTTSINRPTVAQSNAFYSVQVDGPHHQPRLPRRPDRRQGRLLAISLRTTPSGNRRMASPALLPRARGMGSVTPWPRRVAPYRQKNGGRSRLIMRGTARRRSASHEPPTIAGTCCSLSMAYDSALAPCGSVRGRAHVYGPGQIRPRCRGKLPRSADGP